MITVDNGSRFYARSTDSWAYGQGVRLEFSRPGKPMDNPFIESFSGRLRDEHLNVELFFSVDDAQQKLLGAQLAGKHSPQDFAAQWQLAEAAGGEILNFETA